MKHKDGKNEQDAKPGNIAPKNWYGTASLLLSAGSIVCWVIYGKWASDGILAAARGEQPADHPHLGAFHEFSTALAIAAFFCALLAFKGSKLGPAAVLASLLAILMSNLLV